jgi:hypothetical protein
MTLTCVACAVCLFRRETQQQRDVEVRDEVGTEAMPAAAERCIQSRERPCAWIEDEIAGPGHGENDFLRKPDRLLVWVDGSRESNRLEVNRSNHRLGFPKDEQALCADSNWRLLQEDEMRATGSNAPAHAVVAVVPSHHGDGFQVIDFEQAFEQLERVAPAGAVTGRFEDAVNLPADLRNLGLGLLP